ncbi:MAG: hypothetical protein KDA59_18790, partial [Planctomycetales bacterium]|nr:hypothetical protein [Planctomycetales bacterium]
MRHPFDGLERPEVAFPGHSTPDSAANSAATGVPAAAGSRRPFLMQSSALAAGVVTFLFGKSAAAQLNFTEERGDGRGDRGGGNRGRGNRDQRGGRNDRGRNDGRGGWNDDRDDDWLGDRDYNWYDRDRFRDR